MSYQEALADKFVLSTRELEVLSLVARGSTARSQTRSTSAR
jgi:DNA-binding CsgD family transcriptional regulator